MKQKDFLIIILILLPAILAITTKMVYTNLIVIDGKKLASIESEIALIEKENKQLGLMVAKAGTIANISKRAEELNMVPSKISFIVPENNSLASN